MLVVAINLDRAFRCIKGDGASSSANLVDIKAACLLDGCFPEINGIVSGFNRVIRDAVFTVRLLVGGDELLIGRRLRRLVVIPRNEIALDVLCTDALDLLFGNRERHDRAGLRRHTGIFQLLEERHVGVTVQGIDDDIGMSGLDLADDRRVIGVSHRRVLFADDLTALRGELCLDDAVGRLREYVVAADEEHLFLAILHEILDGRHDLLIRSSAHVHDVLRLLHALVLGRIPEQSVRSFDDRLHGLARSTRPATEDRRDLIVHQELLRFLRENLRV